MNWQGRLIFCLVFGFTVLMGKNGFTQEEFSQKVLLKDSKRILKSRKQSSDWLYKSLAVNYVALNTLDLITTFYSLDRGAKEANPIARAFIKNRPLAILIKGGVTGGVLFALAQVKKENKKAAQITLGVLNIMYGLVLRNNIAVILTLEK
ncbi:MAG: hypothetical protein E2O76_01710 [Caldithrix sp.]|nr:MAG: hypothetical protein E2O77_01170 [Caldithrix sp.]TDJ03173.1 MAG: hypothetical protein E2O76_01710 [Caldithrix sp.]